MPDASGPERHFSEKEVGAILKRASELQEARRATVEGGLSRRELEQIAAEMGIEASHLAAAMSEMEPAPPASPGARLLGGSYKIDVEREVEGVPATDDWEAVTAEIGRAFGRLGTSGQMGRSLQWTYQGRHEQKQVTLTPHEGRTRIRVHSSFARTALRIFMPMLVVGLIVSLNLLVALRLNVAGLAFVAGLMGVVFLTARAIFKRLADAERTRVNLLVGEIEALLRTNPSEARDARTDRDRPAGDTLAGDAPDDTRSADDPPRGARRRTR